MPNNFCRYFCTSIYLIVFKKQILQATNTVLFNLSVLKAHNSECHYLLFPLQIKPVKSVKASMRIFIFCTLSTNGLNKYYTLIRSSSTVDDASRFPSNLPERSRSPPPGSLPPARRRSPSRRWAPCPGSGPAVQWYICTHTHTHTQPWKLETCSFLISGLTKTDLIQGKDHPERF